MKRASLLARIYLSTAVAVTALFAVAGGFLVKESTDALRESVEEEVRSSLKSVDSLWQTRARLLKSASSLFAAMSDVRAAFGTRDEATIRDTAGEMWARVGEQDTAFLVADPEGRILARLGRKGPRELGRLAEQARERFPEQAYGFALLAGELWQVAVTPVYVAGGSEPSLLNVLVAAEPADQAMLRGLKAATGGGEFLVLVEGRAISSTLPGEEAARVAAALAGGGLRRYAASPTELQDLAGRSVGQLWALRPFDAVERRASDLRRTIVLAWLGAMGLGLALSYALARRIVRPVRELNAAAQEVARENYAVRVAEDGGDELGMLGRTFNRMCASIEQARAELVRREQIAAVGRLAASIAHDLRNPLAAIRGGAEMVAEFDLPPEQVKEAGRNMYAAAERMNQMLGELSHVAKRKAAERSRANVAEMVRNAVESQAAKAAQQGVTFRVSLPGDVAVVCERARVERVFVNLISNALEAMNGKGEIAITAARENGAVVVEVCDTGPGVPAEIRGQLFQPFVTAGKKSGLGLGLALARQTMLDHGGDLELAESATGARFRVRLGREADPLRSTRPGWSASAG